MWVVHHVVVGVRWIGAVLVKSQSNREGLGGVADKWYLWAWEGNSVGLVLFGEVLLDCGGVVGRQGVRGVSGFRRSRRPCSGAVGPGRRHASVCCPGVAETRPVRFHLVGLAA